MKQKKQLCRSCNNTILKIRTYKKFPLKLWPTLRKDKSLNEDLEIYICDQCKLVQLKRFQGSLNKYYGESFVLYNKDSLKLRADRIKKNYQLNYFKDKKIIEIGGGRNSLLPYFSSNEKWLCDFDISTKEHSSAHKIITSDFIKAKIPKNYFDIVFTFHTLEHIENTHLFLEKISNILKNNGIVFVEVPDLNFYTKKSPNYTFFFQHRTIFEKNTLKNTFFKHRFSIDQEITTDDQSILFHSYKKIIHKKTNTKKVNNKKILKVFKLLNELKNKSKLIIRKNLKKNIAIYGAGGTTITYLYHLGLEAKSIKHCYDIDKRKHGRYIPLTDIKVQPLEDIKLDKPELIIFTNKIALRDFKKQFKNFKCLLI